jgi:hypothetical protein
VDPALIAQQMRSQVLKIGTASLGTPPRND